MLIRLYRYGSIPGQGTFGQLVVQDWSCVTVERPWQNNEPDTSCIPPGRYQLEPHSSTAHPDTWALVNHELGVYHYADPQAKRFAILIHPANYMQDVQGCIGPGKSFAANGGRWMVTHSRSTMGELRRKIVEEDNEILIQWKRYTV